MKADTESFKTFAAMVANEEDFLKRLDAAKDDPLSKESRKLLKHVSRFVVSSGKAIPWSAEERAGEITRLSTAITSTPAPCTINSSDDEGDGDSAMLCAPPQAGLATVL